MHDALAHAQHTKNSSLKHKNETDPTDENIPLIVFQEKAGKQKKEHFLLLPLRGDGEVICRCIFNRMRLELNDKIDSFFYSSVSRFIA